MTRLVVSLVAVLLALSVGGALADEGEKEGRPGHELLGVVTHPFTALTVTRVSDPDDTSFGFRGGVEAEISKHWYGALEVNLNDILTEKDDEVFPWDSSVVLALGIYW